MKGSLGNPVDYSDPFRRWYLHFGGAFPNQIRKAASLITPNLSALTAPVFPSPPSCVRRVGLDRNRVTQLDSFVGFLQIHNLR
jgi:hypothetical protein